MRISDWSSDVCSSDLCKGWAITSLVTLGHRAEGPGQVTERSPWMLGSLPEHDGFRCCKGADAYRQMTSQRSSQVGLACSMSASFHFRFHRFSDFSRWMAVSMLSCPSNNTRTFTAYRMLKPSTTAVRCS